MGEAVLGGPSHETPSDTWPHLPHSTPKPRLGALDEKGLITVCSAAIAKSGGSERTRGLGQEEGWFLCSQELQHKGFRG